MTNVCAPNFLSALHLNTDTNKQAYKKSLYSRYAPQQTHVILEKEERLSRGSYDPRESSYYRYKKAPHKARLKISFNKHQFTEAKSRSSNSSVVNADRAKIHVALLGLI